MLELAFSRVSAEKKPVLSARVSCRRTQSRHNEEGRAEAARTIETSAASAYARQPTRQAPSSSTHLLEEVARRKHGKIRQVSHGYHVRRDRASSARCGSGSRHDHGTRDQR